jgi:hypothetical protein
MPLPRFKFVVPACASCLLPSQEVEESHLLQGQLACPLLPNLPIHGENYVLT